jgi:hypothetical protein
MIVDPESFHELAAHLEHVSRGVLRTAQHVAALSKQARGDDDEWGTLLDRLMAIVMELIVVDKLVHAVLEANREERERASEPLR